MSEDVNLAEYLAAFSIATVEPSAASQEMLKLSLFDWVVCGLAGAGEQVSRITRDLAEHEGGTPEATVIGSEHKMPARVAAFVNGTTTHALDYDDTHFAPIGHKRVAVIPAALAVAQAHDRSMVEFRRAALLGMEASIRAGMWLGRDHYHVGYHQTATVGVIGATVAAARLMGLAESDAAQALGLVGTRASGLKSQFGTMGKPYNAGIAASNGVEVAALASRGFEASLDGLDGAQGLGPTHHGMADESAFDGMGQSWHFENVSHKFHACCHGLHAVLEAMADLPPLDGRVEKVAVITHPRWSKVCNIIAPKTGLEAKFSYRLAAAMALSGRSTAALQSFSSETAGDPALGLLRDRVEVTFDPSVPETYSEVIVTTVDGSFHTVKHDLSAPLDFTTRTQRLREKANALLGVNLANNAWNAAQGDDLLELAKILRMS